MAYLEETIKHDDMTLDRALLIRREEEAKGNSCTINVLNSQVEITIRQPQPFWMRSKVIDVTPIPQSRGLNHV